MTRWNDSPLRVLGQKWPGMNTRGGRLASVPGEASLILNAWINRADTIEKRPGFVRAFDEQFDGVVCGLFRYTSHCGIEYLLVADEESIKIRTPFTLPVATQADCYPFDSFSVDGPMDAAKWRNTSQMRVEDDRLLPALSSVASAAGFPTAVAGCAYWFKDACNPSYQVRVQFAFDTTVDTEQSITIVVAGNGDLSTGALFAATITFARSGTDLSFPYRLDMARRSGTTFTDVRTRSVRGLGAGFFTLAFDTLSKRARATLLDTSSQELLSTEVPDVLMADFGLVSAIGMQWRGGLQPTTFALLVVDGGPLDA